MNRVCLAFIVEKDIDLPLSKSNTDKWQINKIGNEGKFQMPLFFRLYIAVDCLYYTLDFLKIVMLKLEYTYRDILIVFNFDTYNYIFNFNARKKLYS